MKAALRCRFSQRITQSFHDNAEGAEMMPDALSYLSDLGTLPQMVTEARKLLGTLETQGPDDNPTIMGWARDLGLSRVYTADSVPWCGLFMATVATRAGKVTAAEPALGAKLGQLRNSCRSAMPRRCSRIRARGRRSRHALCRRRSGWLLSLSRRQSGRQGLRRAHR
jgi:hypothetical protein